MTDALVPLRKSWEANQLETELKALFIQLYADNLKELADEINVYGAPHLGSLALVQRNLTADSVTVPVETADDDRIRYLFKCWKYLNPERGLHLLRMYARIIYGNGFSIYQLWQKKTDPYPTTVRAEGEIVGSESEFFLTSRVRLDFEAQSVTPALVKAIRSVLPARIVLEPRLLRRSAHDFRIAGAAGGTMIGHFVGTGSAYNLRYDGQHLHDGVQEHDGVVNL